MSEEDWGRWRPLYYSMAVSQVNDPNLWDDCVQEALIHVWLLHQRKPGQSGAYYKRAARRRIIEVARGGRMTGMPSQRGGHMDPMRRRWSYDSLDRPVASGESGDVVTLLDSFHDYDRDREVALWDGGTPQEFCKSGRHRMSESRDRFNRCRTCVNDRKREARARRRANETQTA